MKHLYALLIALLSINSAIAQWEWQNPLPQGNSLNSVFFPCVDTGYAVGDCGTIMKTVNAGTDWELLGISDSIDLNDVFFTDSQNGFIGGYKIYRDPSGNNDVLGVIQATRDGGITWSEVNMPLTPWVNSIYFPNADTGYAACYDQILKTTDGGYHWYSVAGMHAKEIFFIDCNTGYAACQLGNCGSFYKTMDGGLSWTETDMWGGGNSICFINDSIGFVAAGGKTDFSPFWYWGSISKTTDGGLNWIQIIPDTTICFNSIYFTGADTGYAVGLTNTEEGFIMKTTDGGDNWQTIVSGGIPGLNSVFFTGSNTGFVAGRSGILRKTTDAGTTWDGLPDGTTESLKSVYFTNENIGYAVGEHETILKTLDAGTNWTSIYNGTDRCLNSVYFTGATTGYIVGEQGIIYKTVDAGASWSTMQPTLQNLYSVHFPSSNVGYAVGGDTSGIILKTTDSGGEWTIIKDALSDVSCKSVCFTSNNTGYVVGFLGNGYATGFIMKTTDGGETWANTPTSHSLYSINFPTETIGYAVGRYQILKTVNAGEKWISQPHSDLYFLSVFFTDINNGYVGDYSGSIGRTTNGGADWNVIESGTNNRLNSVFFTSDSTGYVAGSGGTILKTTNGGGSAVPVRKYPLIPDKISIYPNPATSSLSINTSLSGTAYILNMSGQQLMQRRMSGTIITIDISMLSKGIYLLKVINEKGVQVGKFIKQ